MIKEKTKKLNFSVYDDIVFASARILKLINKIENSNLIQFLRFDNLHYIDFFASHPFLVFEEDQKEYLELRYYGFTENSLEYMNSKHIFSNQREKLKIVFAYLIAKNLITLEIKEKLVIYHLTNLGSEIVKKLSDDYYNAYMLSADYILKIIRKASQNKIKEYQEIWLNNSSKFAIV